MDEADVSDCLDETDVSDDLDEADASELEELEELDELDETAVSDELDGPAKLICTTVPKIQAMSRRYKAFGTMFASCY